MKKIAIIIIILDVIEGIYFIVRWGENKAVTYETAEVKKGSINNTVTATGTIEPITQVEVGTQVSGTISHIYVDYNSIVKTGSYPAGSRIGISNRQLEIKRKRIRLPKKELRAYPGITRETTGKRHGIRNGSIPV